MTAKTPTAITDNVRRWANRLKLDSIRPNQCEPQCGNAKAHRIAATLRHISIRSIFTLGLTLGKPNVQHNPLNSTNLHAKRRKFSSSFPVRRYYPLVKLGFERGTAGVNARFTDEERFFPSKRKTLALFTLPLSGSLPCEAPM